MATHFQEAMRWFVAAAVLLTSVLTSVCEAAQEAETPEKYPPYPEVWGRELPKAGVKHNLVDLYSDPTGRVVVFFHELSPEKLGSEMIMDFFSGDIRKAKEGEEASWRKRTEENPQKYKTQQHELVFGPNDFVRSDSRHFLGKYREHNFNYRIWRVDDILNPSIIKFDKMLFVVLDDPITIEQDIRSFVDIEPRNITYRVMAPWVFFLSLEDGTFLVASDELPAVIRMRPDLTSPFFRNQKYFLIETSVIDAIEEREAFDLQQSNDLVFQLMKVLREKEIK